jgi:DNA gyrase subunit A
MLMTNAAKIIRCPVEGIRVAGRNTQGVTIFNIEKGERVVTAVCVEGSMVAEEEGEETAIEETDGGDQA